MSTENMRESWTDYDGVGEGRAKEIRKDFETPEDFANTCRDVHSDGPPLYVVLDLTLLENISLIGNTLASDIIDQMVRDLEFED